MRHNAPVLFAVCAVVAAALTGCSSNPPLPSAKVREPFTKSPAQYRYLIGPGDQLQVFVWRNQELSTSVTVRPDGKITIPLVEDLAVSGKTPTRVAEQMEKELARYIREPTVNVMVSSFAGPYKEQIRVIGEVAQPQALPYREHMTALDVMLAVGGLTTFADGADAKVVRVVDGERKTFALDLDELMREGEMASNAAMLPGDVLFVPQAWF